MAYKLAINGGSKAVEAEGRHYIWPEITDATRQAVMRQLDESVSIYDNSGVIDRLEGKLSEYFSVDHALLTCTGTAALHSMFAASGIKPGDEIITPAYTFFATATPLFQLGAMPVLVDSGPDGNIDPEKIAEKISNRTKGIIVTHLWGHPADMAPIVQLATEHGLMLFEDSSHAVGATYNGIKVGTFGDAAAFSMQAQKPLTGGEGGVLLTKDDEIYYRALMFGQYNKRCRIEIPKDHPLHPYATTGMGLKLRIHPLSAAMAEEQLGNLDSVIEERQRIAEIMIKAIGDLPGIEIGRIPSNAKPSWYAMMMQYKPQELGGLPIDTFYRALIEEGCSELDRPGSIAPLNHFPLFQNPGRLFPLYDDKFVYSKGDFPVAERIYENSLKLPVWHSERDEEIVNSYVSAFRKVVENHKELLRN